MLTPAVIEERQKIKDKEKEIHNITLGAVCTECGSGLRDPWDPALNQIVLRCSRDKTHVGYLYPDHELNRCEELRQVGLDSWQRSFEAGDITADELKSRQEAVNEEVNQLIQKILTSRHIKPYRKGVKMSEDTTALEEYKQKGLITKKDALAIIRTTPGWQKAPDLVINRAAFICQDYRLYPGIHVFLICFNEGKTNESWAVVQGIKSNRLLATRKKPYKYIDGPRIASVEEAKAHFQSEYDEKLIYGITKVEGLDGSAAEGWGTIQKGAAIYGGDKGNTPANMVEIRSERRALDRLCPGELPTGLDVVDENFVSEASQDATAIEVDKISGEILPPTAADSPGTEQSGQVAEGDFTEVPEAADQPQGEPPLALDQPGPAPGPESKQPPASKKMGKDPDSFHPKNTADLVGGASYYFEMSKDDVVAVLGGSLPAEPEALADAWQVILGTKMRGGEAGA